MTKTLETFNKIQLKEGLPDIRPGDTVKVYQKLKEVSKKTKSSKKEEGGEQGKEGGAKQGRIQAFEGLVIAKKHGKGVNSTIIVRKVLSGVGVERIFPLHSPNIEKIELISRGKVRRAKLYYLREAKGKKGRLKRKEFFGEKTEEPKTEEAKSEVTSTEEPAKEQEPAEKENK